MRAAAFDSFGPPEVLRWMELPDPGAGPGEVRVRVKAAGVLPIDCKVRSGRRPPVVQVSFPQVPGNEFAGIIDRTGEGVTRFAPGDEVLGFTVFGAYAEYIVVREDQIVRKPPGMPWEVAGGFSANGQGAHMGLKVIGAGEGDTVLIHAAAGGLGSFAVQLAKAWGAKTVIGTASETNHDYLRSLGAIPVNYGDGLAERVRALAPDGVDAALDAAGADALLATMELVKNKDRITTFAAFELAQRLGIPALRADRSAGRLRELIGLYTQGKIRIHIRNTYPLSRAADAHREIESGHGRGKVVLLLDE